MYRDPIAIIGAGSWGTGLALYLSSIGHPVHLWARRAELAEEIRHTRQNSRYLPGFTLPDSILVESDLRPVLAGASSVVCAVPSHTVRDVFSRIRPALEPGIALLSATKGIENGTCLLMSEVLREVLGEELRPRLAVLSGPSFSLEVVRGDPTALVVASSDAALARTFQREFSGRTFRLYTNDDMAGVQIGGAVKNIIAIAAGIVHGLGLGWNTVAALITRGLAEVKRLSLAAGGKSETLSGLAGLGDLVLTCTGALSRNRSLGIELGKGRPLKEILSGMHSVAEGVLTTKSAIELARRLGVEMPIAEQMHAVLYSNKSPQQAIRDLMERELKSEL